MCNYIPEIGYKYNRPTKNTCNLINPEPANVENMVSF